MPFDIILHFRGRRGFTRHPRVQTCTFKGSGLQKHQNSTRRHPERHKKSEMVAGEGKKSAKFCAVRRRGVQWRGGPAEGGPGKSKPATTTTTTTTTTPNPEQVLPRRAGPLSQARFRVWVFRGWAQQQHNKTTQQHNNTTTITTTPENFAKTLKHFGQSRFGQSRSTL